MSTKENDTFLESSIEAYEDAKERGDRKVMLEVAKTLEHFGYQWK